MSDWIVVATDGSEQAAAAVEWAADEARLWRRGLRIVHVTGLAGLQAPYSEVAGFAEALSGEAGDILQAAAETARRRVPGVHLETQALSGAVVPVLLAEAEQASETVLGSRGRGGFTGMLLGSVGLSVAGHAHGPVVIVRERPDRPRGEIVVGFDLSEHSSAALAYALEQARVRKARVRAVHAWQVPATPAMAAYPDLTEAALEGQTEAARKVLEEWRAKYPDVPIEERIVTGHPVTAITEAADGADLVVVGSRGHGALRAAVLGSVSHGVIHHVTRPVAVVR
ncbi:nucleotide-binding universal stress UspA family protein [Thermocatellispora tengchongensis]|uniref:Nucleotide-binding universal stress UspA family protein n=1 Tax=Thermocatellispora tengchongensis TaxID=1073253 RepID=A0A840NXJ8_9ACTN|nr:universal stress protein [Thermocatellispora tengchongensis]MBB5131932.1 nucleotide-binding universal stress UspA family protein [Thermocatellispora tengchongensis]